MNNTTLSRTLPVVSTDTIRGRVFNLLLNGTPLTAEQISTKLPTIGINNVRSRLTELLNEGLVVSRGVRRSSYGINTYLWTVRG